MAYKPLFAKKKKKTFFFSQSVHSVLFLKAVDATSGFGIVEATDLRPLPLFCFQNRFSFFSSSWSLS